MSDLTPELTPERIADLRATCANSVRRELLDEVERLRSELAAVKADRDRLLAAAKAVAIIDCDPFAQGGLAAELRLRQAIKASEGGA